jgi:porin
VTILLGGRALGAAPANGPGQDGSTFDGCNATTCARAPLSESAGIVPEATGAAMSPTAGKFSLSWREGLATPFREPLERNGVRVNIYINDQFQSVVKGGLDTNGSGRNAASMDAFVAADLHQLRLVENADALLHVQSNWGRGINDRVGALTEVNDDADGDLGFHVAQLWYRHHFFDRKVALTLGFLDFQTIVDRNAFANSEDKQFWNQSLDNNPLVPLAIGLGASLEIRPTSWWTVTIGAADAQSVLYKPGFSTAFHDESWFVAYAENAFRLYRPSIHGNLVGNYRVGVIFDPRQREVFRGSEYDDADRGNDYGAYVSADQQLFAEGTDGEQGLGIFMRAAFRSSERFRFPTFWSGGLSYRGMFATRDRDVLGFGVGFHRSSHVYRDLVDRDLADETVYELFYAVQVNDWLVVTPDVQYIDNPGGSSDTGQAIAVGVRVRISM